MEGGRTREREKEKGGNASKGKIRGEEIRKKIIRNKKRRKRRRNKKKKKRIEVGRYWTSILVKKRRGIGGYKRK